MGSGESDAHYIKVAAVKDFTITTSNNTTGSISTGTVYDSNWYKDPQSVWYYGWYPTTVYKYQVKCPARGCKTYNWLELDKTTPCTKCSAKLRAVSDKPDFNIPVTK